MKVKTVEIAPDKKMGVVWCQGCGAFHGFAADDWNKDETHPSTREAVRIERGTDRCVFTITDGVMAWDAASTHRLAGESRHLPHEESWSVHGPDQTKVPVGVSMGSPPEPRPIPNATGDQPKIMEF